MSDLTPEERVRQLKAHPWFTCVQCGSQFRYGDYHGVLDYQAIPERSA